jgi:hypothetical protein
MKNLILGTIAATAVLATATAASAQMRNDRTWSEMRTPAQMAQAWEQPSRRNAQSYGNNIRFERSDSVN